SLGQVPASRSRLVVPLFRTTDEAEASPRRFPRGNRHRQGRNREAQCRGGGLARHQGAPLRAQGNRPISAPNEVLSMSIAARRHSGGVDIGGVMVGGGAPVVVQSMTNTDTADIDATVRQVMQLSRAGSELVRITVDRDEAAAAVPIIRDRLAVLGYDVPLVGDFHYIGHKLLTDHPACAEALAKYRINPGNVGFKAKRDTQFSTLIDIANRYDKPVRIGVNWGSLDEELLTRLMDENAVSPNPISAAAVQREAIIQ